MPPQTKQYLLLLAIVIIFAGWYTFGNPNKKYHTQNFWKTATVEDAMNVPDKLLMPGQKNGPILMWASMATNNPDVIEALVKKGADVNGLDDKIIHVPAAVNKGSDSKSSTITAEEILALMSKNQKLEKIRLSSSPLSAAASINSNPAIIDKLIMLGAIVDLPVGTKNKTPLIIAAELTKNPEIIKHLIQHGASTAYKDSEGRNALEAAIFFENTLAIEELKQHKNQ